MLYQIDQTDAPAQAVFGQFWASQDADDASRAFAECLVRGVVQRRAELDGAIAGSAEHWRIERMAVVDRNVLRMAVYELLHCADIPPKVTINEAIEIGKKFSTANSGAFINGILDRVRIDELEKHKTETGPAQEG